MNCVCVCVHNAQAVPYISGAFSWNECVERKHKIEPQNDVRVE